MTKAKRRQTSPLDAFHKHFASSTQWGERWHRSLYPALVGSTKYAALYNRYVPQCDFHAGVDAPEALIKINFPLSEHSVNGGDIQCYVHRSSLDTYSAEPADSFPQPIRSSNGLATHWNLDAASLLAVHVLSVQPGDQVLDLCAAPGGKSIALAQSIWPHLQPYTPQPPLMMVRKGCLHANEIDGHRQRRLDENLLNYLPSALLFSNRLRCFRLDGTKGAQNLPLGLGGYDKVLLDAPCSSERHIVHAQARAERMSPPQVADELVRWSPSSSKQLAETQIKLLITALRAVRTGGRVLYATCSILKQENDEVVEKAIQQIDNLKRKGMVKWTAKTEDLSAEFGKGLESWAERTRMGWFVLPDHPGPNGAGWGPLYFAVLTRVAVPIHD